jgi:hypothetical protein
MKRLKQLLIVGCAMALGSAVSAALLGVFLVAALPDTNILGPDGTVNFDAATRVFTMTVSDASGGAFQSAFPSLPAPDTLFHPHALAPVPNALSINIKILDSAGLNYVGNGSPNDFVLSGTYDINGNGVIDANESGTLLTGSLTQFGFFNRSGIPATPDAVDFHFAVTGGAWAAFYAGKDIGVRNLIEADNWADFGANSESNSFSQSFHGSAKADVLPVLGHDRRLRVERPQSQRHSGSGRAGDQRRHRPIVPEQCAGADRRHRKQPGGRGGGLLPVHGPLRR